MTDPLAPALARASSRLAPPATPWRSVAIHAAVLLAWIGLFTFAFVRGGVLAWAVGIAYIAYDTLLQGFVGWQTWRLGRTPPPVAGSTPCRLAVLVAAHNEARVLPATIAALQGRTIRRSRSSSPTTAPPTTPAPCSASATAWCRPRSAP